jgi:hypothetical protein
LLLPFIHAAVFRHQTMNPVITEAASIKLESDTTILLVKPQIVPV